MMTIHFSVLHALLLSICLYSATSRADSKAEKNWMSVIDRNIKSIDEAYSQTVNCNKSRMNCEDNLKYWLIAVYDRSRNSSGDPSKQIKEVLNLYALDDTDSVLKLEVWSI